MAGIQVNRTAINPFTRQPYGASGGVTYAPGAQPQNPLNQQPVSASPLTNQYNLYNAGVKTNAEDYSGIMEAYRNLLNAPSANKLASNNFTPYTPQQLTIPQQYTPSKTNYAPSADVTSSLANLKGLSETGGYNPQDIADLRARGISPIRAVYANAQRNINRSRALQGGYSPSYNAVTSKMTRELSDQIGNATQNVNAGIAENVARGRLGIAPQYASAAGRENELRNLTERENASRTDEANKFNIGNVNDVNKFNIGNINEANKYNTQTPLQLRLQGHQQDIERQLQALSGMHSLYGTTPALSKLFGDQAMNSAQFQNLINEQQRRNSLNVIAGGLR